MSSLFNNIKIFSIVFFIILVLDIVIKNMLAYFPYRYISKFLVILLLVIYYIKNKKEKIRKNYNYMVSGLVFFLLGDLFIITHENTFCFVTAMILFVFGKTMYCLRFSNNRDFNLIRLIPFSIVSFILMVGILLLIIDSLGNFLIPVLLYFFISFLVFLLAYLRKGDVNKKSYRFVVFGMYCFLASETIMVLKTFYTDVPYNEITIMLSYGIAQYLIVLGIVSETKLPEKEVIN